MSLFELPDTAPHSCHLIDTAVRLPDYTVENLFWVPTIYPQAAYSALPWSTSAHCGDSPMYCSWEVQ